MSALEVKTPNNLREKQLLSNRTAQISPLNSIDLAFDRSGRISKVYIKGGDQVIKGQSLVELDNIDLISRFNEAQANVEIQKAKLSELKNGAKSEASKTQMLILENARVSLESAQADLLNSLQDGYIKADDAVRNKVGQFFNEYYAATQQSAGSQVKIDLLNRRNAIEQVLVTWKVSLDVFNAQSDLLSYAMIAKNNLSQIEGFLDNAALVINNVSSDVNVSQVNLRNWRSDIFTGRSNVIGTLKTIAAGEGKVKDANLKLKLQEFQLTIQKAGPSEGQIKIQEGLVNQAEAQTAVIQAEIDKTILTAPVNGIIKKQTARVGFIINRGVPIVSLAE